MDTADTYTDSLRSFMSADFRATRKGLGLTQEQMAGLLEIDPRSYADLEHGKSLCCTRVFLLYLFRCKAEQEPFLEEIAGLLPEPQIKYSAK